MKDLTAYVERQSDGQFWLCCPWCGKKYFPVSKSVKIKYLPYKCKSCGNISPIVDVGYSVRKKKQIVGQLELDLQ